MFKNLGRDMEDIKRTQIEILEKNPKLKFERWKIPGNGLKVDKTMNKKTLVIFLTQQKKLLKIKQKKRKTRNKVSVNYGASLTSRIYM